MWKVGVSDCDHAAMDEERAVFAQNDCEMELHQCRTEADVIRALQPYAVIANQYAPMTAHVFDNLPNLKCIVRYGVGVDHVDLEAASAHGIAVCNVPDYGVQEVASHAAALLFALCRKLIPMNAAVKGGAWKYEQSIPIWRLSELTIGVIGIGRIGKRFAHIVRGLDTRIVACDPRYDNVQRKPPEYIELMELEALLAVSDIVSIHTPLETSRGLIGEKELRSMKPTSYLINVSRGGIVDEAALYKALKQGWIAGAACDVLCKEPPAQTPPLFELENFICTPHMAWYSQQASSDMKTKLAEEMVRFLRGEPLRSQVNK